MSGALTVVLVHWNQPRRCVDTVRAFEAQGVPLRLLIVDNGSEPAALTALRDALPEVELLELGHNAGFGPAANAGLQRWLADGEDGGEWAAVAPHDALPEPGCLRALLDAATPRARAGLASAEFGEQGKPVVDRYLGGILADSERRPGWEDAGHPHGTLLLARRACLEEIGLFDERYFAYCEEADLGLRATRAGWGVGVVWGAVVRNPSWNVGTPIAEYLRLRNSLYLVRWHFGRYPASVRLVLAVLDTAVRATGWRRPPVFSARARGLALLDYLRGRTGPPPPGLFASSGATNGDGALGRRRRSGCLGSGYPGRS